MLNNIYLLSTIILLFILCSPFVRKSMCHKIITASNLFNFMASIIIDLLNYLFFRASIALHFVSRCSIYLSDCQFKATISKVLSIWCQICEENGCLFRTFYFDVSINVVYKPFFRHPSQHERACWKYRNYLQKSWAHRISLALYLEGL